VIVKCLCMLDRLENNPDADYFADISRLDSQRRDSGTAEWASQFSAS
jgi:hypothetical protein